MPRPKIDRLLLVLIPIILPLLLPFSSAYAETRVFIEEYTYQASEADSKLSSRVIALEPVKRLLLEKLGTYPEGETEVKKFQLTKDQIVILTAAIVSAEIIDEKWDGKTYYLKAKIGADPKEVIKSIDLLRQDRQKTKELEEARKKADEALKEVEKLKRELEIAKTGKIGLAQYNEWVNRLSAVDWLEKGLASLTAGKYQEAIEPFTKAIELDPNNAATHFGRGAAYSGLGDHRQALRDVTRAVELDPNNAATYFGRGAAYFKLGQYRQAIRDFDRGIELNPKHAEAYYLRGLAYANLGEYRQAIKDFDRAIELNPKNASAYSDRGHAYGDLRDYQQTLEDFKNAARLGDKGAQDSLRSKGIGW